MGRINHTAVVLSFQNFRYEVTQHYKTELSPAVLSALDAMQADVDVLLKAWSIMAGRNLMSDLMRKLLALEPTLEGAAKESAIRFKTMLAKRLDKHNPGKARYDSVICLGYRAKTSTGTFDGQPADYDDLVDKANDLVDAIKKAKGTLEDKHKTDGRMLKLFMAPEFFFRGVNGGYDFAVVDGDPSTKRKGLVDLIKEEIDGDDYKDWLFVLGTVVALSKHTKFECSLGFRCKAGVTFEKQPDNTTKPVCKGGRDHVVKENKGAAAVDNIAYICKEKYVHTVIKELISPADFKSDGSAGTVTVGTDKLKVELNTRKEGGTAGAAYSKDNVTDERMGGVIFSMDGITFACEICLDHIEGGGKSSGRADHAGDIQIQLVPSAGMSLKKFQTVPNGVVFNVDGLTPHVQAAGVTTANSMFVRAIQSTPDKRQLAVHRTWDTKAMEAEFDIEAGGKDHKNWIDVPEKPLAAGKRGSVVQLGPFEIPAI